MQGLSTVRSLAVEKRDVPFIAVALCFKKLATVAKGVVVDDGRSASLPVDDFREAG